MTVTQDISASDYEYRLPDHWILSTEDLFGVMHEAYVRRVVEIVRGTGAKRVLEVGCGDGWNCGKLVEAGVDAVGIDWSKNGIEHARRMVPKGRFFQGDVRDASFRREFPEPFDAAIFVEVLEHIPPPDCPAALRNIAECLKPGGMLVLTTPSVNKENTNPGHYRHFTEAMIRELAPQGGFRVESIEGYGDVQLERRYYKLARFIDNRYYLIKGIRRRLLNRYRKRCLGTPMSRCHGIIATMKKA